MPTDNMIRAPIDLLSEFMTRELTSLRNNVVSNYQENMANRALNPFLAIESATARKYMALGRSIDSQLGNRIQRIIYYIARMRYGAAATPNAVCIDITDPGRRTISCALYSIPFDLPGQYQNKGFDPYKQAVYISKGLELSGVKRRLKIRATASDEVIVQRTFNFDGISEDAFQYLQSKYGKRIPVDLMFFNLVQDDLIAANTFEIKMSGNLDTKNAASNAAEVMDLLALFEFLPENRSYFSTCYGQCSQSVTQEISRQIGPNHILNGETFWQQIFPTDEAAFSYGQFLDAFRSAFRAAGIETALAQL